MVVVATDWRPIDPEPQILGRPTRIDRGGSEVEEEEEKHDTRSLTTSTRSLR